MEGCNGWEVSDGHIVSSGADCRLVSRKADWRNFDLRIEYRINDTGNNGVLFRCQPASPQSQGDKIPISNLGGKERGMYRLPAPSPANAQWGAGLVVSPDKWVTLEVTDEGHHITTRIDGQILADVTDDMGTIKPGCVSLLHRDQTTHLVVRRIAIRTR